MSLGNSYNKTLKLMGSKLSIQDTKVFKKSDEFLRLLQLKMTNSSLNQLNEYSKAVICLDLAASVTGVAVDFSTILKLSGLKRSIYINSRNTIRNVLKIDQTISIKDLCIQFGCTSVAQDAQELLDKYKQSNTLGTRDFEHPQYSCISVYTVCRLSKINVHKSKLIELSRLRNVQWNQLKIEFLKFAESINIDKKIESKLKNKNNNEFLDIVDSYSGKETKFVEIGESDNKQEDYDTWRARILEYAFNHLDE